MASRNPFSGIEQADVAFLQLGTVAFRCFVWQRNTQRTIGQNTNYFGATVEAAIFTEQAHGQESLLWRGTVRTPASGEHVDCPRVVALGQSFHVHWLEYDPEESDELEVADGRDLHRSTFDVEDDPFAWVYQGSISTSYYMLYDTQSLGANEDYIIAHASDTNQISVRRVNGDAWIDTAWTSTVSGLTLAENVLAVSANRAAPMVVYQSGSQLQAFSHNWADGTVNQPATFVSSAFGDFTAVGLCQRDGVADDDVFLVAEYEDGTTLQNGVTVVDLPTTMHGELVATALGIPAREYLTPNTTLQSKPWRYVSPRSLLVQTPQMFAALGFQSARLDEEWLQSHYYVARYETESSGTGRPMLVATMAAGIADARKHGAVPADSVAVGLVPTGASPHRRRNHLPSASPAPSFGPLVKSYTLAMCFWSRIDTARVDSSSTNGITVAGAKLEAVRFHHDDAWAYPYDDSDPPLPSTPYASVGVPQLESVHAGDGLFLSGGTPQTYDGHRFVEAGFPWRPEIVDAREHSAGAGPAAGNYSYTAVYEWRDARGQTHRSQPADPVVVTVASGFFVHLEIRCCNLSAKDNNALGASGNPVKVDVYRTESGGSIFYPLYRGNDGLATDLVDVPTNTPTALTVQVEDGAADADINDAVPLSFTRLSGNWTPLPGETVPALGAVASWQNRVVGVSSEETKRLWISREILPEARGEQYTVPEFNATLTFRIDQVRGRVVALQEMDSALILFTREAIYALHGSPADATGAGSTLNLQLLQRDTGCIEPRSVAPAPDGVYFQSRRGLYKLTRANALEYVGADIEDELRAAGNVRAVTVHEDSHQVRVLCNGGAYDSPQVLVYDWRHGLWALWPLPDASSTPGLSSAVDALSWRGHVGEHAHVVLQAGGVLISKPSTSASLYADEGATTATVAIPVDVRTGWIHLAGLAGFKRVRKVGLHFTKPAAAAFTVELEYDLTGTQTDGANIQTELVPSTAVGFYEIRTSIQKCNAIRIRIYEDTTTPTGAALTASTMNLHAITLDVARKKGFSKVSPTTQRT